MLNEQQVVLIEKVANAPLSTVLSFISNRLDHLFDGYTEESDLFSDTADLLLTSWEINYFFFGQEDADYGAHISEPDWFDPTELRLSRAARLLWLAVSAKEIENTSSGELPACEEVVENYKMVKIHYPRLFV
jgi:hypothetical protein